jgi:isopenicillin-N epimerase
MSTTRRSLLLGAAAAASLLPTSARKANAALPATAPTAGGDREAYWEAVRAQFAFRDERVPMNAANLCPSPRVVAEEVAQLTRDIDVDCSFQNRAKFDALLEGAREKAARQLGASADEIALVRNTSEANSHIHNGLSLGAGDRVVIWDQNHPSNHVAWKVRAQRFGFEVEEIATPEMPSGEDELAECFAGALGPRTRVLALTHVSNVSGVRLPIARIAETTRARGIWLHVDGAQTWGASHIDLRALGVDSYSASAHKWFCGPKEVGLLYVRAERWTELWPGVVAPSWGADVDPDPVGARRFESLGQRDDAALAAVGVAADFHDRLGPARVEQRVLALAARLKLGAVEAGYSLVTPAKSELSGGVCIVAVPQAQRQEIYERLYRKHGIAGATTGGVRLCPHVYNTVEHVDRAVAGLRALRPLIGTA